MAPKTDLSFAEVNSQFSSPIFAINAGVISLNINTLTGDTYTDLDDLGILEMLYKLIDGCKKAQDLANESLAAGESLVSFNAPAFGVINSQGRVQVTTSQDFFLELSAASVVGENA